MIHGEQVQWAAEPQVALAYLLMAGVCALFTFGAQDEVQDRAVPDEEAQPPMRPAPAVGAR